jgi:photosystem II stability/assembly factor-like uncharacterized protein
MFQGDGFALAATMQDGVLTSADHGVSWQAWNFGLLDLETIAIAVSPKFGVDQMAFVATVSGLYRSTNAGRAWREVPLPPQTAPLSSLAFVGTMLVAGSEEQGLLYSPDMGINWAKRNTFKSGQVCAAATSRDSRTLAVATPSIVACTNDLGQTWARAEGHVPHDIISLGVADDGTLLAGTQQEGLWFYA